MGKKHPGKRGVSTSLGSVAVRAAGIAFIPVLLPAAWTGSVDTAWAACTAQPDDSYLCSGASSGEILSGSTGPLTIIADSTLNIDGSPVGFDMSGSGDSIVFSQAAGSNIIGAETGIHSKKSGAGSNKITVAGNVTGNGNYGIWAENDATATDARVEQTAGTITGVSHGIRVDNWGTGSTSITTAGTVIQTAGDDAAAYWDTYGVYAYNALSATDITLTQTSGTVSGHYFGIYGNNQGTGSVIISSAGDVTATGMSGLAGFNSSNGKDVRISQTAGTITANGTGIDGRNDGSGSTHISTAGTIIANDTGVYASNGSSASDLSVTQTAGAITGGTYGIDASNAGTGTTSIAVSGEVSGGTGAGILAVAANDVTIDIASTAKVSTLSGLAIHHAGAGNAVVTSAGQVTGDTSLGIGGDTFNLMGGSYTGNIFGDDRDNAQSSDGIANSEGNDTFTWTSGTLAGGFYGQDGSDTATISAAAYDGSQVFDGGDDTSGADGMVDTLNLSGVNAGASGSNIANWEIVNLDGGALAINDGAWKVGMAGEDASGVFLSNGATLDGMAALALDGRLAIDATSAFMARGAGAGAYAISGDLVNAGTVNMQDGVAGDALTVAGNYIGNNGSLHIDTVLGDDSSRTDSLRVGGDTSGATRLLVNNVNGTGAPTVEGIRVISVGGLSAGGFSLVGDYTVNDKPAIVGGAYAYQLYQGGISTPDDGDWYLRSQLMPEEAQPVDPANPPATSEPVTPLYQAGVPSYEAYPQALLALNSVPTLQQRVGNRYWAAAGAATSPGQGGDPGATPQASAGNAGVVIEGNGIWGRVEGAYNKIKPSSTTSDTRYDQDIFRLQIGVDRLLKASENGKLVGGLAIHYARGKTNTQSPHGDGEIDTDGYGVGGTLTWYGHGGFYLDGQARATWYDSDLSSRLARRNLVKGNDGFGYVTSIEGGKRIALDSAWSITPQAQLAYSNIDFDTFTDPFGARVSNGHGESLQGRLGVTIDHENSRSNTPGAGVRSHVYGLANLHYEFLGASKVNVADATFASRSDRLWASVGVGGSYNWDDDKYSIYGEGLVSTSLSHFADSYSVAGQVGFRMRW